MQGFNMGRYRPPSALDADLSTTTSHPAKSRRLNATPAAPPTVRFEMPFAIWCSTCPSHSSSQLIGQGVRFNAQKKKVGNYYSTPVWSFRMKHTACGGWIEIRTDPKSSEYIVTEGARKRDTGDDLAVASRVGGVVIGGSSGPGEDNERERKRQDAFAALEGKKEEKIRASGEAARIEELKSLKERDWKDTDAANKKLRGAFRVGRRKREKDAKSAEVLQERMGLGIELLDENEEDQRRAGFVDFGNVEEVANNDIAGLRATMKPLFNSTSTTKEQHNGKPKNKLMALHQELSSNTRAVTDPFSTKGTPNGFSGATPILPGVKRKRDIKGADPTIPAVESSGLDHLSSTPPERISTQSTSAEITTSGVSLVNYDSE